MRSSRATLLVGGHGFIGGHLANALKRKKHEVLCPRRIEDYSGEEANALIWAAGYTADYKQNAQATLEAHAGDLSRLLASYSFETVIYLSSARLYDVYGGQTVDESIPLTLDPENPRHLYDASKAMGEWLALNHGGRGHVVRVAGVYDDKLKGGSFLEDMVARSLEGWAGPIETSPDTSRDYVHVDDVCSAILAILERGTAPIYNVGSGETVDNRTLLGILSERTGHEMQAGLPAAGIRTPVLDISKLKELGVSPRSLSEGLDRVLTVQDNMRSMQSMLGVERMPWM